MKLRFACLALTLLVMIAGCASKTSSNDTPDKPGVDTASRKSSPPAPGPSAK